jgi:hypothetical protein
MNAQALKITLAVASLTLTVHSAFAEVASPAPQKYELKKRSAFNLPETTRPPFWPIGWVKKNTTATVAAPSGPRVNLDEKNFAVTSILTGNPSLAVINGRSYTEGEYLRSKGKGQPRIRVLRIYDGFVQLQCEDQVVSPKLRREELEPKKAGATEELLLDDER